MTETDAEREAVVAAVYAVAERIEAEREYLTDLDSAIGDADHGANMSRGFQEAVEQVAEHEDAPPDDLVGTVGRALISEVGGAAGPLYGGGLMKASGELVDGVTAETTVAFGEAFLESVQDRGDARPGQKTMVDALVPAVHTYRKSIEQDDLPPLQALAKAVDACERGVNFTVPIKAEKGRASYLGWRSVGHQDPGATSTLFIVEEILETAREHLESDVGVDEDATAPTTPEGRGNGQEN
jgi:dihydroxyacetone kinase-like protein